MADDGKRCGNCAVVKSFDSFSPVKLKSGNVSTSSQCKDCINEYGRRHYQVNKEKRKAQQKTWYEANRARAAAQQKAWYEANRQQALENGKNYRQYNKKYIAVLDRDRRRERYRRDQNFRLISRLRCRLYKALAGGLKRGSAIRQLGCTIPEMKMHLERNFHDDPRTGEVMSWENYGCWHIDHIRPLASFDLQNPTQLAQACHYTNLQPLWAWENLKKSDKYQHSD